jgi:hypothetical protein
MLTSDSLGLRDLVAIGAIEMEGGPGVEVRLVIPAGVRRRGRGPMGLAISDGLIVLDGGDLIWLVTTNKGWVHMRGEARTEHGKRLPFRADLYASTAGRDGGPDRFALRLYAAGDDPNRASPIAKLGGPMAAGSITI